MCIKGRSIRNRVKLENETGFDYYKVNVPCNDCSSCRLKRSNDWLVRGYYEFMYNKSQAFFITLDYDDNHLPLYHIKKHRLLTLPEYCPASLTDKYVQPCFNMEHMKTFFARLRYYIGKFRYMYSCDYGGFLRRPHLHLLLLPENFVSELLFHEAVKKCWSYGSHTRIDILPSVQGDKLRALSYITSYVTKEFTFDLGQHEKNLPCKYRYQAHASKGFGMQALDYGHIDLDMIKKQKRISLPIGKNGTLLHFDIPRYYEMKFTHDYRWDRAEGKAYLVKNQEGIELSVIRHNRHYIQNIKNFFASRHDSHPILGLDWYHKVLDVMFDFEHFKEYMYLRPFLHNHMFDKFDFYISFEHQIVEDSRYTRYEEVLHQYDCYLRDINNSKFLLDKEVQVMKAKERAFASLKYRPDKLAYLKRRGVLTSGFV